MIAYLYIHGMIKVIKRRLNMNIQQLHKDQRTFYETHTTKEYNFRIKVLKNLEQWIITHESDLVEALKKDLHKAPMEAYMSEIGMVLSELRFQIRHLKKWMKKHYVKTPISQFYARSFISYEPYGLTLIISPWNYPFLLCMNPTIGAIAAGNCVMIKPSEHAPHTSTIVADMIAQCCAPHHACVIQGDTSVTTQILDLRFDYIFFTGSTRVGKIILEKVSQFLTPVTLELGGKSPCIIDDSANIKLAAKRITFGKYLNAGQTCIAPDYILISKHKKQEFLTYLKKYITDFFKHNNECNHDLPCIINNQHFQRLIQLLQNQKIIIGGNYDINNRKIEPTVLDDITITNPIMKEEVFGPILPILTYETLEEAMTILHTMEKPLSLYLFTTNKKVEKTILQQCSFGGGCINDTISHIANPHLGFGGVGYSGIGRYHGFHSFQTFSNKRGIMKKANWIDIPLRYHPYDKIKNFWIHKFLK